MPILRSSSKRRSRADLTVEMISAPLADFRHTMHIGRGGDTFGDTSFLSTKPAPTNEMVQPKNGLLMRKFRGSKHSPSERNSTCGTSYMLQANSTISLPAANDNNVATLPQRLPKSASSSFPEVSGLKEQSLETSNEEQRFEEPSERSEILSPPAGVMKQAESILSFHIDLGPSMLGDILSVMDQNGFSQKEVDKWDTEREWKQDLDASRPLCDFTSSLRMEEEKTHNTNGSSTHSVTYTPRATSTATPCTTESTKFSAPSGATHFSTHSTSSATHITIICSAPTGATHSSAYDTAFSTTPSNSYSATSSNAYNAVPSTKQSTAHSASIDDEDFLFMDEDDDDEIRL